MITELYDGRMAIGTITPHRGGYHARDAAGERVGNFGNKDAAIDALMANYRKEATG